MAEFMPDRSLLAAAIPAGALASTLSLAAAGGSGKTAIVGQSHNEFSDATQEGCAKYVEKDFRAAVLLFRKATQLQPRNPLGYYLLGEAQLGAGSLADAEAAWIHGDQVSESGPPSVRAKLLFVLADLRERQGRWEEAKTAWKRYADFASEGADAGAFPQSAEARTRDISAMQKQYGDYAIVRKRIREEDGGTIGKMPPAEQD
jgi:tetratricopeptide (TPR) repeat protein